MKQIISLMLLVSLMLPLTGCAEPAPAQTSLPPQEPVVLDVVSSYGGDDGNRASYEAAVASYEAFTGNEVRDVSSVSNEEWKTQVLTDFITGSEPDVLFYFTNADANPIIHAGKVVSIEEIREAYPDYATNMKPAMMPAADDGKHYAVPSTGYWESLYVNQSVLDQCGIAVPGPDYTWEQFLADCTRLKSNGFTPIACSLFEIPHYWFEFMVMNNGTVDNHLATPHVDENGVLVMDAVAEKWIAALEDLKFLYDSGFFPENTLTATDAETVAMFAEGEAAFLVDGSWKMGFFMEHYPEQLNNFVVSYVPGKGDRSASDAIGGISMGYFITRKAWDDPLKRKAAVEFVFHMTSEEILSTFVTTEVTALVNTVRPIGSSAIQQSAAEAQEHLTGMSSAVQDTISGEAKRELFSNIHQVMTGQMSPAEAIEEAMKFNEMRNPEEREN